MLDACNTPSLNKKEGSQASKSLEDPSFYLFDIWTPRELVPLSFAFPPCLVEIIKAAPKSLLPNHEDCLYWHPSQQTI